MISCHVEFFQGSLGALFRIIRTPVKIDAHIFYVSPLFEQANQTRHMLTRSAINAYHLNIESIIYDHYGCGDSAGELTDTNLANWQRDLLIQIEQLKKYSTKPVFLSLTLSAALLLTNEVIKLIDGLLLAQPEFNGKQFVRQFKRIALVKDIIKPKEKTSVALDDENLLTIAGYQINRQLINDISDIKPENLPNQDKKCIWFEWFDVSTEMILSRTKQLSILRKSLENTAIKMIPDVKYWQATELQIAEQFLKCEQEVLTHWLNLSLDEESHQC